MILPLVIDGFPFLRYEVLSLNQSYEEIRGGQDHVMADGSLVSQCFWKKTSTTIDAESTIPPALGDIRHGVSYTIDCSAQRAIRTTDLVYTVGDVRPNTSVTALAYMQDGSTAETNYELTDGVISLTEVENAIGYIIRYYPRLTVKLTDKQESCDTWKKNWKWSLTFREV